MTKRKRKGGKQGAKRAAARAPAQTAPATAPAAPAVAAPPVPAPRSRTALVAIVAAFLAMAIVHAIVAFWTPVQGDDWNHWIWAGEHGGDGAAAWLRAHLTFDDAIGYLLARCHNFHVIVSPAAGVALVIGLYTVAVRRLPRATWDDLLGLGAVSAALWVAQPHAGLAWFHVPSVGDHVYGAAIAVWVFAPFRCGWKVPAAAWPALVLGGYCAGTSTRAIATALLVAVVATIFTQARDRRRGWMWIALAAVFAGTVVGYARPPWAELGRVFRRGFEPNLVLLKLPIEEAGRLIGVVVGLVLADVTLGKLGRSRAVLDDRPPPTDTLWWFGAWVAASGWALFGPKYYDAMLLPATCLLAVAAVPYLCWLATSRPLRIAIVAGVALVHLVIWPLALVRYHDLGEQGAERMASLRATKPGRVAFVRPFKEIVETFWVAGEDFSTPRVRELVAIEGFGLRDIQVEPTFRRFEANPDIAVELQTEGVSDGELRAAGVPAIWAHTPSVAREQFALLLKRLHAVTSQPFKAWLRVKNLRAPKIGTRPVFIAWTDEHGTVIPKTAVSPLDELNQYNVRIYGNLQFAEALTIADATTTSAPYRSAQLKSQPRTSQRNAVLGCVASYCLLIEAYIPRF